MNVVMIGTGYVGLVTGACFAELGHKVTCVDTDAKKIQKLLNHIIPIYEPGLEQLVIKNHDNGNLQFSTTLKTALVDADFVFIAVGTPMGSDGSADLQYVLNAAAEIGTIITKPIIVVTKSTVPVGTSDKVGEAIRNKLSERQADIDFAVASNPEFLKEGNAIKDFMQPDRVVVGAQDPKTFKKIRELYMPILKDKTQYFEMSIRSAELTKYAANAMLATKISFINEISNISEAVGADINDVRLGIGADSRIGNQFINPGSGYGGSCFPKDVRALSHIAKINNLSAHIIDAAETVNQQQKLVLVNKVKAVFSENLTGKTFAIWGLSFKPETDDMREASSLTIIQSLINAGAKIKAFDPQAINEAKHYLKEFSEIDYVTDMYQALDNSDALLLVTEWNQFKDPNFQEILKRLKAPIIFDGRNLYHDKKLATLGFQYHQIGVQPQCPF